MKKRTFQLLGTIYLVLCTFQLTAQDFHYTQFYYSPYTINPALTGAYIGDIRVINNYRSQWSSITSAPYKTLSTSVDGAILRGKMKNPNDYFSMGVSFNNDKAGVSHMTTNLYNAAAAFTKSLSGKITNDITLGAMFGYGMRSVNYTNLTWDNQYQNGYNSALPSGEPNLGGVQKSYMDMSAGILWNFSPAKMWSLKFGVGALHLNTPNVGFVTTDKLYSKYVVHGIADIKLGKNSNMSMQPAFEYAIQGPSTLINLGTNIKYVIQDRSKYTGVYSEVAVSIGGWCRIGDAAMFTGRLDYGQFALAVSYDANLSDLSVASSGRGGFELLFIYTGVFKNGNAVKVTKSRI